MARILVSLPRLAPPDGVILARRNQTQLTAHRSGRIELIGAGPDRWRAHGRAPVKPGSYAHLGAARNLLSGSGVILDTGVICGGRLGKKSRANKRRSQMKVLVHGVGQVTKGYSKERCKISRFEHREVRSCDAHF